MPDLREKRLELVLQSMEELPTLPAVAVSLLEVTGSEDSSASDVVRLIESDPALTARILRLVRHADLGVGGGVASGAGGDITSVSRAVVLLGFDAVRNAVLAVSVFEAFQQTPSRPKNPGPSTFFSRDEFWKHCVATACCAELLATTLRATWGRQGSVDPSDAFVCGLLHDVGKVALDAILPKSFARVIEAADLLRGDIADLERTIVGLDHMVIGKRLAERWDLPADLRDCIWLHGQLPQALPTTVCDARLVNLITLADVLVREQHLGYSGNYLFPIPKQALLDAVGLTAAQVDGALAELVDQIESRAAALGLGQASTSELYQQALSRANKELGQVTTQLTTKNRKLAVRAKFFDALSGFQAGMRPDSPPSKVLEAIGQTAVSVLDVSSAAIFSLPPGRNYAETVLVDSAGEVFEKTIIDCETASLTPPGVRPPADEAPQPAAGEAGSAKQPLQPSGGPVLPAGTELEWLLSAVSPRLAHVHRFWICLEADGRCIGGVVWGGAPGESNRLGAQVQELTALSAGWALALRASQIREDASAMSEQLADSNRRLQNAQGELLRSRTMVSVGEMAAGAAHEMNNPLAVISGRSQLLASQLSDPRHKAAAHLIYEQSHRLSEIITELMDFARPTRPKPVECDMTELVGRALHDAKAATDSADRTVETVLADVPLVKVDRDQITAALVEIIANALQATDPEDAAKSPAGSVDGLDESADDAGAVPVGKGAVSDKYGSAAAASEPGGCGRVSIQVAFDPHSARVVMTVADDGCGMDEVTARRAFDPFFSARPAGRRRGLGLAKALRWVEGSGGSMNLESQPGKGTRAVILLPAAPPAVVTAEPGLKKA